MKTKILIAQILLYIGIFFSFNNKTFILPIILFLLFLSWTLEDWKKSFWITLVATLPFAINLRTYSFSTPLPWLFWTPCGQNEIDYSISLSMSLIILIPLFLATVLKSHGRSFEKNDLSLIFFLIFALISFLFSPNQELALVGFLSIVIPVCFYFLARQYTKNRFDFEILIQTLSLLVLFEGLWACAQFVLGRPLGRILESEAADFPMGIYTVETASQFRSTGTLSHPNTLAIFLGILLPLVLSQLTYEKNLKNKLLWLTSFLGILGFIFTLSRWAWICLFVVIGYIYFPKINKRYYRYIFLIIPLLLFLFIPSFLKERILSISELLVANSSLWARVDMIKEALNMILNYPLTGVGPSNFLPTLAAGSITGVSAYFFAPVHSLYLLMAAELGLPALFSLLLFIFTKVCDMVKNSTPKINLGILGGAIFYLLSMLGYTGTGVNLEVFFLILGIFPKFHD